MNELLMQVVVQMVSFLQNSDEEVLDSEVAAEQIDDIAAVLDQLAARERKRFVDYVAELAESIEDDDPELADIYRGIPHELGLV